eukprot:4032163-Pleurochrysis_carterae.AAC.1
MDASLPTRTRIKFTPCCDGAVDRRPASTTDDMKPLWRAYSKWTSHRNVQFGKHLQYAPSLIKGIIV